MNCFDITFEDNMITNVANFPIGPRRVLVEEGFPLELPRGTGDTNQEPVSGVWISSSNNELRTVENFQARGNVFGGGSPEDMFELGDYVESDSLTALPVMVEDGVHNWGSINVDED